MEPMFLEIIFDQHDLAAAGLGRDELEDPLAEAFKESKLGAVTGGGSSSHTAMIEVELVDGSKLADGIALIRRVLIENRAPSTTKIKQLEPELHIFGLAG
ncbi:MAG TPA: hypothetical protein VGK67_41655 [Myxococcales bacterium]|jgi:hypothetical protein